jgi:MFS transporter, FHS family, L-fucose permease
MNQNSTMQKARSYAFPIFIIGLLFFIFGFVTWLNGILIPFLRTACELSDFQAWLVTTAFYISYFVMALPSSVILRRTGFRMGMSAGLWTMAIGALIFIPAAYSRSYWIFLVGLFVQGTGLTILQTASNPYITILGPRESAARRISIMGIANKIAGIIAPIILASIVLKDAKLLETTLTAVTDLAQRTLILDELAQRVISPYMMMAGVLVLLGFMIPLAHLPEVDTEAEDEKTADSNSNRTSVFQFPQLVFGVIALFFYVGVEVIAGDSLPRYGQALGISMESAKYFTSLTLLGMVVGYVIGILLIPRFLKQNTALIICALLGIVFTLCAVFTPADRIIHLPFRDLVTFQAVNLTLPVTALFIALLGIANSLVWPAVWPLALDGLGKFTKTASALLIMAILGGATLPLIYGKLSDLFSNQQAYWLMIPCYLVILLYAAWGHSIRSWKKGQ